MLLQSVLERARSTGRRWTVAGALIAFVATTGAVVGAAPSGADVEVERAAEATALTGFTVQVGPEERVYGPTGIVDFPYFSEKSGNTLYGYISNNDSYRVTSRGTNRTISRPRKILPRGRPGSYDKCGAWLMGSVYKKPGTRTWVGLYHAEAAGQGDNDRCIFSDDSVVASIGRAVSHDAGKTWRKTGRVLTQDDDQNGPMSEDATMGRVLEHNGYLYVFYGATSPGDTSRRLHVARSPVSDLGAAGTWEKFRCYKPTVLADTRCDFAGPDNDGLGGKSSPLRGIQPGARVIIPNTYLNHYIGLAASGLLGFRLWVSNNAAGALPVDPPDPQGPAMWGGAVQIFPQVSHNGDRQVDNWNRTRRAKQLYAYPSIVGVNGESYTTGQSFYIYYVKLFPGGDFPERYLMRRKVLLTRADTSGLNRVELTTYVRKSDGRRRTSSEQPFEKAFKPRTRSGFLLAKPRTNWVDVYECVKRGRYQLRTTRCARGESKYRRVGWIRKEAGDSATVPIYKCYNRRKKNSFTTTGSCGRGAKRVGRLGFGLPPVSLS